VISGVRQSRSRQTRGPYQARSPSADWAGTERLPQTGSRSKAGLAARTQSRGCCSVQRNICPNNTRRAYCLVGNFPGYPRKYGVPENLVKLDAHRYSAFRRPSDGRVRVGDNLQDQHINPDFCTNDEAFELRAVLAGEVIGQLAAPTAAQLIRTGRLVPLLIEHISEDFSLFIYYGSRAVHRPGCGASSTDCPTTRSSFSATTN